MNLTGKCLTDFKEWYINCKWKHTKTVNVVAVEDFEMLHPTYQQGVLLAFFRDKGIFIKIFLSYPYNPKSDWYYILRGNDINEEESNFPDYSTAFNEAVNKAVEIYNGGVR